MSSGRIPSLDAVRGLAFLTVFADHADVPGADGPLGVTAFFFLSGYLITTLLLREEAATGTLDVRAFWARRALRILPLFYLVLAATAALTAVGAREAELRLWPLVAQALHGSNYLFIHSGEHGTPVGTDTYWSLGVEEHYYLVFPLLALLAVRRRTSARVRAAVLLTLCCTVLAWRWTYVAALAPDPTQAYLRTYLATDMRVDGILWGAWLAVVLQPERLASRVPRPLLRFVAPAGLVAVLAATAATGPTYELVLQTSVQSLALALLFTGLLAHPPRLLQVRPLVWLGAVSYAAYLVHRAVLEGLARVLDAGSGWHGLLGITLTLALAEACRRLVEQPVARLRPAAGRPAVPAQAVPQRVRAGTPATTAPSGTSLVTTAPAPTNAPAPTVRP